MRGPRSMGSLPGQCGYATATNSLQMATRSYQTETIGLQGLLDQARHEQAI